MLQKNLVRRRPRRWLIITYYFEEHGETLSHDYERKLNWRTGKMQVHNDRPNIYHSGSYFAREYEQSLKDTN